MSMDAYARAQAGHDYGTPPEHPTPVERETMERVAGTLETIADYARNGYYQTPGDMARDIEAVLYDPEI